MMYKQGDKVAHRWLGRGTFDSYSQYEGDVYITLEDGGRVLVSESNLKKAMPTYAEWLEKNPPKCKCCEKLLPKDFIGMAKECKKIHDTDYERLRGFYCNDCYEVSIARLMNKRFVASHKGYQIFFKEKGYQPWWGSAWHFDTVKDCKLFIDHSLAQLEQARKSGFGIGLPYLKGEL